MGTKRHLQLYGLCSLLTMASFGAGSVSAQENDRFEFYGQVNPGYYIFDDGVSNTNYLANNDRSNTRIGFWSRDLLNTKGLNFNFETALGVPSSSNVSQVSEPQWEWNRTKIRKFDLTYETSWGKFYVGQGSMSTDGTAEADFSGTGLVATSAISDDAGSFLFRDTGGALTTRTISDVFQNLDGSRRGQLRFDTASLSGFTFSGSVGREILKAGNDNSYYDAAVFYEGNNSDITIEAKLGSAWVDTSAGSIQQTIGSLAILHNATGLNGALSGGLQNSGGQYIYAKVGVIKNWLGVGATAVSFDYYKSDGIALDLIAELVGFGFVQNFADRNFEAYFGLRYYDLSDKTGVVSYLDANHYALGARYKF